MRVHLESFLHFYSTFSKIFTNQVILRLLVQLLNQRDYHLDKGSHFFIIGADSPCIPEALVTLLIFHETPVKETL